MARGGSSFGSAVIQVSQGDLGPALWELARAQEIKLLPPRGMTEPGRSKERRQGTRYLFRKRKEVGWGEGHAGLVEE